MSDNRDNYFTITIDRDTMFEYYNYYKKLHPKIRSFEFASKITEKLYNKDGSPQLTKGGNHKTKTRKRKLEEITKDDLKYGVMSLNEILVIQNRMTMNGIKHKYGELGLWLAERCDIKDKLYSNAVVEYRIFKHTNAKADNDNLASGCKFINDCLFVESNAFIDDNFNHINPLIFGIEVDTENPRTEIRVSIIEDEIKNINEKINIHINNFN